MDKKKLQHIINEFMQSASPQEQEELARLLKTRKKKSPIGSIDSVATSMAKDIQKQMGLTDKMVKETARNVVASLAKQYNPGFSDREINAIVNEMVPDNRKEKPLLIEPDIMLAMVRHFIDYSTGRMKEEEENEFPSGWQKKYWQTFPPDIQKLIAAFLKQGMQEQKFWNFLYVLLYKR